MSRADAYVFNTVPHNIGQGRPKHVYRIATYRCARLTRTRRVGNRRGDNVARQRHVKLGEVEESGVQRHGIDIVAEPDRNVRRAELDAAEIDTRPRPEHHEGRKVARKVLPDSLVIFPESMEESAR